MTVAVASKIVPIEITILQDEASFIGEVFIVESKLYNDKLPHCGIVHTGRITNASKGDSKSGATISFISGQSISVGNSYVVFLNHLSSSQLNNIISRWTRPWNNVFKKVPI